MKTISRNNILRAISAILILLIALSFPLIKAGKDPFNPNEGIVPVPEMDNVTMHGKHTLAQLYEMNNDTIGWIYVPDTPIDYVVLQPSLTVPYEGDGESPDSHYLHHDFYHNYYYPGEIFLDARCTVSPFYMDQNLTVYGHHMANGTMFARLDKYKYQSFFNEHPVVYFDTLWHRYVWRVFATFTVDLNTDEGAAFDYRQPYYENEEKFLNFISQIKACQLYETGVEVKGNDKIITLQTCTFPTGNVNVDNARLLVMAKLEKELPIK